MNRLTFRTIVFLMGAAAFISALLVADHIFLRTPHNADEFSYLFQAHNFAEGIIARPFPPNHYAFYNSMIIVDSNVGWLSRYPFGHPLFLLAGLALGDPYLAPALAAGLSVIALCWTGYLIGGYPAGIAAGLALLISPFRIIYGGTLLSHTSGLLKVSVMLLAYAQWRLKNRPVFAVLAGLAWAWFVNNRTYTAGLIALPFALDAILLAWNERTPRRLVGAGCFALSSAAGIGLLLIYNRLAVGDFMTMTYLFYNRTDALGFGLRRYGVINHTLRRGVEIFLKDISLLNVWLWGFPGSLIVWAGLLLFGWTRHWSRLCLGASLCVCLGYILFCYPGLQEAGPAYYYETLPFLALGSAFGITRLWKRFGWKLCLPGVAVALLFGTRLILRTGAGIRVRNLPRHRILEAIKEAPAGSLIYIDPADNPGAHIHGYRMIFNPRGLDGETLVALWIPEAFRGMSRYFADYSPYKLVTDDRGDCRLVPLAEDNAPLVEEHEVVRTHFRTGSNEDWTDRGRGVVRAAREGVHGPGPILFGRRTFVAPGRYAIECELLAEDPDGRRVGLLDVAADTGRIKLGGIDVKGNGEWKTVRLEFEVTDFRMIEPRAWYSGHGNLFISALRLRELSGLDLED